MDGWYGGIRWDDRDRDEMSERLRKRWTVEWRDRGREGWGEG